MTLPSTVFQGNSANSWNTGPRSGPGPVIGLPSTATRALASAARSRRRCRAASTCRSRTARGWRRTRHPRCRARCPPAPDGCVPRAVSNDLLNRSMAIMAEPAARPRWHPTRSFTPSCQQPVLLASSPLAISAMIAVRFRYHLRGGVRGEGRLRFGFCCPSPGASRHPPRKGEGRMRPRRVTALIRSARRWWRGGSGRRRASP